MGHSFAKPLIALGLVLAGAPLLCQEEERPYFALNSSRTYAPGEKATVTLTTVNVPDIAFRVYRINDPIKFFQSLEDPHMFGGQAQRPPHEKTLIERFHTWKRGLRDGIRWGVRDQFSQQAWTDIHSWRARKENRSHGTTTFATTPVLNSQQLVATWQTHIGAAEAWHTSTIPIEVSDEGVYLVEATRNDLRAFSVAIISRIGIISKVTRGRAAGMVAMRSSGEALKNCDVLILMGKDQKIPLKTNADGVYDTRVTIPAANEPQAMVMARSGQSFAASSLNGYGLMAHDDQYTGYAYTDRPVYRPGHQVSFKGILRLKEGNVNRLPVLKNVSVEITGPEDKKFYQKSLDLDGYGSVADNFTLPADAPLGSYSVTLHAGESQAGGMFEVQEYKKPEYEVRVSPAKKRVLQGASVPVTIDAQYFFGEPVANAKVQYVVHRSRYWDWSYYGEPDEDQPMQMGENDWRGDEDEQILEETGKLDANGKLQVNIVTDVDEHSRDMRYRVEARVTDAGNREITGSAFVLATYGSFRLRIEPEKWFVPPGATAGFNITAKDYDNQPVSNPVTVELWKWVWSDKKSTVVTSVNAVTDVRGNARVEIAAPKEGGGFQVRVKSKTTEGREVKAETYLYSGAFDWGDEGGERRVQLVPDQKHYKPGDTAHVLIVTGVPHARVLVSTEGAQLGKMWTVEAKGPSVTVDIPITAESAPDIFVSASFFQDNEFYSGMKMLKVPPEDRKLAVEITSSKPQYTPGEGAQLTILAKDAAGKPANAEISLGVVDEAIYGIRQDSTPDAVQIFYGTQYNSVQTDSSLNYFFHGEAGQRRMQLAALRPRRSFAQVKPDRLVTPKVRKAFPDTTLWLPKMVTDASGKAVANFSFPDSITAWRATARAITADTKSGGAVLKTIVRKNVILRLVTPRFFTVGDEVTISAIAHNYLATAKQAKMTLDVKGLDILDGGAKQMTIDAKGEAKSDWRVRATNPGSATITGAVLTDEESDAMELPVPVNPYGVKLSEAKAGAIANSGSADVAMQFPKAIAAGSKGMEITVSPSVAGAMFSALDYLTAFPYGCTEQTMSSFLPNVIVSQALQELKVPTDVNKELLGRKLQAGLERLADFQHEDGGWGWWKTDESDMYMTAYVVGGLSQAKAAGVAVNDPSIQRGVKWLQAAYKKEPRMVADLKAYAVYSMALAGMTDPAPLEDAWSVREKLSPIGVAILGLAFEHMHNGERASTLAGKLEGMVKSNDAEAWWPSDHDYLMDYWYDTTSEATAFSLKFLSRVKPESPLLAKAVQYLMDHRQGVYWYSTKQTAMVIFGLTDYLKRSGELKPNLQATVTVNGKQVLAKSFGPADALAPLAPKVEIAASDLGDGNQIHVTSNGTGRLYWSVTERYYSTDPKHVKEGSVDLNLLRDYYKLTPQKSGEQIVYSLDPVNGALAVGDVVAVRLTVTGSTWRYLLVEDPIPAGTEFIERDDLYKLKESPPWWHYFFSRRELHDDRMALFRSYFYDSQQTYFYLLKVVNPGKFRVCPAHVQPMYQPKYISTTEGKEVEFK